MSLLSRLPGDLEDAEMLMKRRGFAEQKKNLWRSTYRDAYQYAMPARETFTWHTESQQKNRLLYDSTLQEATYTAANTLTALLFPSWMHWAEFSPGAGIPKQYLQDHPEVNEQLQDMTDMFFAYLNSSNFNTVISEAALDLQVGTCALSFDEGDQDNPFVFQAIPLSAIELEEGPTGAIETTWMCREPHARNLLRMYKGMELIDLPEATQKIIKDDPEKKLKIIQGEVYDPETKKFYGVVLDTAGPTIIWRYDYGTSSPTIVARASKVAGETYGRGRVLLALSDARTVDRMQEFVLTQAALQVAPPMTGVSYGILNPYTASLTPNTIIPVASNADNSPSLRPLEIGGNFQVTEVMMKDLRERIRRTLLGPEPSEGPVKSATEISVADRNRLWAMNGEYNRIQAELLAKIVARGVFILQRKGLAPKVKVNGRQVAIKYTSPFAKTQNTDDVIALQETLQVVAPLGPEAVAANLNVKDIVGWVARKKGIPEMLITTDEQRKALVQAGLKAQQAQQQNQVQQNAKMNPQPPDAASQGPPLSAQ